MPVFREPPPPWDGAAPEIATPGLLLAASPGASPGWDRVEIPEAGWVLGRDPALAHRISDRHLSRSHARFFRKGGRLWVQDLASDNGTFVQGVRLEPHGEASLPEESVVRCGRCVLVSANDLRPWRAASPAPGGEPALGRFYGPRLQVALAEALSAGAGVGLVGPAGAGKERALDGLAHCWRRRGGLLGAPLLLSPWDLAGAPWGEDPLPEAGGGAGSATGTVTAWLRSLGERLVALRQAQSIPPGTQRALAGGLRWARGREGAPTLVALVETAPARDPERPRGSPPRAQGGARQARAAGIVAPLAEALEWVPVEPLAAHRADVPDLFAHHLKDAARWLHLDPDPLLRAVRPAHLEALCLADLEGRNLRALAALAETFAAVVRSGTSASPAALGHLLADAFPQNPVVRRSHGSPRREP